MQVGTIASGKTVVIAPGKPFKPSTIAISLSLAPRFLSTFITHSQNLAAFGLLDPQAEHLLVPGLTHADGEVHHLVADQALVTDLDAQGIEEDDRIGRLEWPGLPGRHFVDHRVR